jgi:transcriptional regulator PpsR
MRTSVGQTHVSTFETPKQSLSGLGPDAIGALLSASADLVLVLDAGGIIRDVSSVSPVLTASGGMRHWVGKRWADLVTLESKAKIARMLDDAADDARVVWRQVNIPSEDGADLALSFCAIGVGPKGRVIALGRDLRAQAELQQQLVDAQQALERDYLRLRHLESRYRTLFDLTGESVLVVDGKSLKIVEANPAAATVLGGSANKLVGRAFLDCLDASSRSAVAKLFDSVLASGKPDQLPIKLSKQRVTLSVSMMHEEGGELLLLRVAGAASAQDAIGDARAEVVLRVLEQTPDAFVITNIDGDIIAVNRAFAEMVQLPRSDLALGESLDRWLGRAGVDLNVLLANLRQRGSVRLFATTLRNENGIASPVEISAVSVPQGEMPGLGFTIRDIGRRLATADNGKLDLPRSAEQLTELVGRVPLREIVGETTDLIERLCIEAALQLTQDNRATAAEVLGLSRQSLYVKMRQFGIGNLATEEK